MSRNPGSGSRTRGPRWSLAQFHRQYGTESQCERAVARMRWPQGYACPRCGGEAHSRFEREGRSYWQCSGCRHQTTATAGTLFQGTRLPLRCWFLAIYLLTQTGLSLSSQTLAQHLGVSYKSAWALRHKLLELMASEEGKRVIQADRRLSWTPGAPRARAAASSWSALHLDIQIELDAQGRSRLLQLLAPPVPLPRPVPATAREAARRPQLVLNQLRRSLGGPLRNANARKYGRLYLAEFQYRFNRGRGTSAPFHDLVRSSCTGRAAAPRVAACS